jgi:membrane protein implicated in regulation of membrane protease activity
MSPAPFVWAIIGILLMAAESLTPGFWVIFFGAGGLLTAALTWLVPGLAGRLHLQVLLWLASSSLLLIPLRRVLQSRFGGRRLREDSIGSRAIVVEAIAPGKAGRIRFAGTTWRAESYDEEIAAGETVEILAQDGLTYFVSRPFLDAGEQQGEEKR